MSAGSAAILVPVLRRPHRVEPLFVSARLETPAARILFIASPGDEDELAEIDRLGAERIVVDGNYAAKINAGVDHTSEEWVFTGADDLRFHPFWLERAIAEANESGASVIGTQDLCNPRVIAGEHATHFLVRRSYVEEFGTIDERGKLYHDGYPHEYVDDELIATAKHRGLYSFAADSVVEHMHPLAGKAPTDDLYEGAARRMAVGRRIFARRRALWSGA